MPRSGLRKIDPHGAQTFDLAMDGLAEFDKAEAGDRSCRYQMSGLETAAMIPDKPGEGAKNIERVSAGNAGNLVKDRLACDLELGADTRKIHACPIADRLSIDQAGIDLVVGELPQGMSRLGIGEARINHLDRRQRGDTSASPVGEVGVGGIGKRAINPESHFEFDADQAEFGPGEPRRTAADPISRDWRHDGRFSGSLPAGLEGSDGSEGTNDGFLNPIRRRKIDNRVFQVGAGQLPTAAMCGVQEVDNDGFIRTISHNVMSPRLYRQAYTKVRIYHRFGTVLKRISALAKLKVSHFVGGAKAPGPAVQAMNGLTIKSPRLSKG